MCEYALSQLFCETKDARNDAWPRNVAERARMPSPNTRNRGLRGQQRWFIFPSRVISVRLQTIWCGIPPSKWTATLDWR